MPDTGASRKRPISGRRIPARLMAPGRLIKAPKPSPEAEADRMSQPQLRPGRAGVARFGRAACSDFVKADPFRLGSPVSGPPSFLRYCGPRVSNMWLRSRSETARCATSPSLVAIEFCAGSMLYAVDSNAAATALYCLACRDCIRRRWISCFECSIRKESRCG
jgi:hypothetical protein